MHETLFQILYGRCYNYDQFVMSQRTCFIMKYNDDNFQKGHNEIELMKRKRTRQLLIVYKFIYHVVFVCIIYTCTSYSPCFLPQSQLPRQSA